MFGLHLVASPEQTALVMLRDDATYHEVAKATGLKIWRIERLAKSAKIVRVQGRRSRLTTQLASANLTRKQLQEATGLSRAFGERAKPAKLGGMKTQ